MAHKSPFTAGVLSLFLPGLGLLYLGYKKAALLNFVLVNVTLIAFVVLWGDPQLIERIHYLFLGLAALSAGYARGVALAEQEGDQAPNGANHQVTV